jgi:dTMP kinase
MKGKFIVLEGMNGAGKTTQTPRVTHLVQSLGQQVLQAKDPESGPLGAYLRPILKDPQSYAKSLSRRSEFLLFAAIKVDMIEQVIHPTLEKGTSLVSDRFNLGIFAYQGYSLKSITEWIEWQQMEDMMLPVLNPAWPDLTLLLDILAEVSLARTRTNRGEGRRYDDMKLSEKRRIREGYLHYRDLPNVVVIDGDQPEDDVFAAIKPHVERLFAT